MSSLGSSRTLSPQDDQAFYFGWKTVIERGEAEGHRDTVRLRV